MKTILALLLLLVSLTVFGQGTATRAFNGFNTNGTFVGNVTNINLVESGTTVQTNYTLQAYALKSAIGLLFFPAGSSVPGVNINGSTGTVTATNSVLSSMNLMTNAASMGLTLNLNGGYQDSSTNNNVLYTGFTFINTAGTGTGTSNIAWTTVLLTNTSGSLKTVGFLGCVGDTNVYITNQSAFTVLRYPGRGTNVVGRSLN